MMRCLASAKTVLGMEVGTHVLLVFVPRLFGETCSLRDGCRHGGSQKFEE